MTTPLDHLIKAALQWVEAHDSDPHVNYDAQLEWAEDILNSAAQKYVAAEQRAGRKVEGLGEKYEVYEAGTGRHKAVTECFVLRPDRDPAARKALLIYAHHTDNDALSNDIHAWVRRLADAS